MKTTTITKTLKTVKNIVIAPVVLPAYHISKRIVEVGERVEAQNNCDRIVKILKNSDFDYDEFARKLNEIH